MKTCSQCKQELPVESFALKNKDHGPESPRQSICLECNRQACRERYKDRKQQRKKKHSEWNPEWASNIKEKFIFQAF